MARKRAAPDPAQSNGKGNEKPWEAMGVSKATYYRRKKTAGGAIEFVKKLVGPETETTKRETRKKVSKVSRETETPEKPGEKRADHATRFQPGNPGKPKGTRNKLTQAFVEAMCADFEIHGDAVIQAVRGSKPEAYLAAMDKASGLSVIQAMEKLLLRRRYQIQACDPRKLDKMARVIRVQPEFSRRYIHAPLSKAWAMMVVNECAVFPRGSHDDLVDSTTQGIYWLRSNGFLEHREEQFLSREEAMKKYKQVPALYSV